MKKILAFALALTLLFTSAISVLAADVPSQKEEVVYGLLNLDGSVNNLHVVNIFKGGEITDYGDYSNIRNMTSSEQINQTGDKISINTNADKFYYQGTLKAKDLPWDIAVKYYLDDKEISASEIAGKSGRVKITVSVKENSKVNKSFFDNYALQIALSLDNKLFSNIKTENATVAEAGSKKQLAYTVLPGKGMDITVTADVHGFEMDAISINGIKLNLGIDVDTDEFTGQISKLQGAIKGLDNGAGELLNGLTQLSEGMQSYVNGMKAYSDGLAELPSGAEGIYTGAAALSGGLSELSKQNGALVGGALAIQQSTFDSVNAQLGIMGIPVLTPENYNAVLSNIPSLAEVKKQLDGVVQFTNGLKGYTDGVSQLGVGASELAKGTEEFKSQSSVIAASANELYKAGAELNGGIKKLRQGLASYKDGTKKFRNETSSMDSEIDKKIDEMLTSITGKGDKVVSFVSEKNSNVSAVQFVLKTDAIVLPEAPEAAAPEPVKHGFWQKLLRLFGVVKK